MWFLLAITASSLWGVSYVFEEHLYRYISPISWMALCYLIASIVFGIIGLSSGVLQRDWLTLIGSSKALQLFIIATVFTIVAGALIAFSISTRNATVASLIEISYPIFIVLFGYLIFRENNLNLGTIIGGLCIFLGILVVYLYNR